MTTQTGNLVPGDVTSVMKRNKLLIHTTSGMHPKGIILSGKTSGLGDYKVCFHLYNLKIDQMREVENSLGARTGEGWF